MKILEITVPVYNEESDLPKNIPKLFSYCEKNLGGYGWKIIIVDNGSKDGTWDEAGKMCELYPERVCRMKLDRKGRGWALRNAWKNSEADIVGYMDIDLSSDINDFSKLVGAIESGCDLAVGSRNMKQSLVVGRTVLRGLMSKSYIFLAKLINGIKISDTQCGFKALDRRAFLAVEPLIMNNLWFFDSEMVIILEKAGFKVRDIPIKWVDDKNSTVKVLKDSWEELSGLLRLRREEPWKKLNQFFDDSE